MFGPRNPRLPTEVCLAIFKDQALSAIDLLRCASVSRAWHALILNTNDIRALLFLAPLNSQGKIEAVTAPVQDEPAWMALLYKPPQQLTADFVFAAYERYDRADLLPSWDAIATHPLLFEFEHHLPIEWPYPFDSSDTDTDQVTDTDADAQVKEEAYPRPQRGYLGLTYQLFQHLSQPRFRHESASWRQMRVAHPPITEVYIRLHPGSSIWVHDECGVTLGHVVDKLRGTGPWRSYDVEFGRSGLAGGRCLR